MKNYTLLFLISLLFEFFISVYSENINNDNYIVAILRKETDKNYDEETQEIQDKIDEFINDKMNEIYKIIEENKDSYILNNGKQDEKLSELNSIFLKKRSDKTKTKLFFINKVRNNEKKFDNLSSVLSKRSDNSTVEYIPIESTLVSHICPISNFYAISVYLSDATKKIVCEMENVLFCEKNRNFSIDSNSNSNSKSKRATTDIFTNTTDYSNNEINYNPMNNNNSSNSSIYYDINAIKKETKWSDVSVQQITFTPNHLALISQSPFINQDKPNDTNFYYPSSAGKGIDIYLVDTGLYNNHEDFNTYEGTEDERTITCDAIVTDNDVHFTSGEEKNYCFTDGEYNNHGVMASSLAGGTIYGIAKKANIHMISIEDSYINALKAFDIILQKGKSHKIVVSLSIGFDGYNEAENLKLSDLINKGFIVIAAAGNSNRNCCHDKSSPLFLSYPGYRKTITVGAAANPSEKIKNDSKLIIADFSNYGDCVDIFAPFESLCADPINGFKSNRNGGGTSAATPIVAGVAASLMSEHPEIKFDNELMRKLLIEISIKDSIDMKSIDNKEPQHNTPNRFINNGKQSIYYPESFNNNNNQILDEDKNICENYINNYYHNCIFDDYFYDEYIENNDEYYSPSLTDQLIKTCAFVKLNKCQNIYTNNEEEIKKEILLNPSCSRLYENGFTDFLKFKYNNDNNGSFDFTLNHYKKVEEKCESVIEKDIVWKKCNEELESLKMEHPKNLSTNEIVENCYIVDSNSICSELLDQGIEALPNCLYVQNQFQTIELIDNIKEICNTYNEACLINPNNNIKEKIISNCEEALLLYDECLLNINPDMTLNEVSQKCEIIYSNECNKKFNYYVNEKCDLARKYISEKIFISDLKRDQTREICSSINDEEYNEEKNKYINDCENLIDIYKEICKFNEELPTNENELKNKCQHFLNCKDIYENPYKFITECQIAKWFKNDIEIKFNISDEVYKILEEKCLSN